MLPGCTCYPQRNRGWPKTYCPFHANHKLISLVLTLRRRCLNERVAQLRQKLRENAEIPR